MTLNPGCFSSRSFNPARMTLWSSANKMRISFTVFDTLLCEWKVYSDDRATAGLGMYSTCAVEMRHPLFDTEQSQTLRLFHIESSAVVSYRKRELVGFLPHIDAYRRRMRMPGAVVKCFLHDAVDARFVFVRQIIRREIRRDRHVHAGLPGNFTGLPSQCGNETQVVQHRRPQKQRHFPDGSNGILDQTLDRFHMPRQLFFRLNGQARR